ncbi:MAG: alpha/beta fold hydrolase [Verrucomicrobia bacterium]|nr:alpha/beta fold hydrolase [Verrucomicrobiota bacterium]
MRGAASVSTINLQGGHRRAGALVFGEGTWIARDGSRLVYKFWRDVRAPKRATILLVHGLNGAVDDLEPMVEALAPAGYEFFACGLRGQGADPNRPRRGDLRDWRRLRDDLIDFRRYVRHEAADDRPVFAFGESMGALVTLQAAPDADLAGAILSSPVVKFRQDTPVPWWQEALAKMLFRCAPWYRLDLQALARKDVPAPVITRDQVYLERIRNAPCRIPRFTVGFYRELIRLVLATPGGASRLRLPVLVLAAGQDVFVRAEDVASFFDTLPAPDKTLRIYPSSYHLLVRDFEAAQVIRDVHAWLDERTSAA